MVLEAGRDELELQALPAGLGNLAAAKLVACQAELLRTKYQTLEAEYEECDCLASGRSAQCARVRPCVRACVRVCVSATKNRQQHFDEQTCSGRVMWLSDDVLVLLQAASLCQGCTPGLS